MPQAMKEAEAELQAEQQSDLKKLYEKVLIRLAAQREERKALKGEAYAAKRKALAFSTPKRGPHTFLGLKKHPTAQLGTITEFAGPTS